MAIDTTTDTTQTADQASPEPQRAGNIMIGPAEEPQQTGPTYQDRIAEARRLMESGENPLDAFRRSEPAEQPAQPEEPQQTGPAGEPEPVAPAAEDVDTAQAEGAGELPEGYVRQDDGRIRGPDGRFYAEEQVQALMDGQAAEPLEAEAPKAEPDEGEDEGIEEEGEPVRVSLPGRRPDDPDEEFEVTDPALAESINRLRNGYMRREEFERQMGDVHQARAELQAIEQRLAVDPENFLIEHIPAERRAAVARHLLADETVWSNVVEDLARWDQDELERRAAWAELRAARLEASRTAESTIAEQQAAQHNAIQVRDAIQTIVPDEADPETARVFLRYAIRDLTEYVNANGIERLDPAEVPFLLQRLGTLQPFGFRPAAPASEAPGRPNGGQPATVPPQPARPRSGPADEKVAQADAQSVGQKFKKQAERRAQAAAVAPAGVGAAPARLRPPEGQSVEERLKWARENMRR